MAYIDTDTIQYHLPEGYHPEFLPEPVRHKSAFGEYTASVTIENGVITYIRTLLMNKGTFPATAYNELIEFRKKIIKADKTQIVFVNKS
jgi:hypothetical protein